MVYSPTLPPSRSIGESLQLPKLADFASASTSSLISPVVLRGVIRLIDVAIDRVDGDRQSVSPTA